MHVHMKYWFVDVTAANFEHTSCMSQTGPMLSCLEHASIYEHTLWLPSCLDKALRCYIPIYSPLAICPLYMYFNEVVSILIIILLTV